jgi:glucose-6-phosphate-specific signal transduction histidine kinase
MYREGSHGLMGIRERAYMLGGELEIGNARGGGGRIRVRLPLRQTIAGAAAGTAARLNTPGEDRP